MVRPDRSDVALPEEKAARIEAEAREYFESLAPKRFPKPSRSENDSVGVASETNSTVKDFIPHQLDKLQVLEKHQQKLVYNGNDVVEEYVETEYYKDLNGVDKQHHTTGTGFIKVEKSDGSGFDLIPVSNVSTPSISFKGNPATNEWIPSSDPAVIVSKKPNRSDP